MRVFFLLLLVTLAAAYRASIGCLDKDCSEGCHEEIGLDEVCDIRIYPTKQGFARGSAMTRVSRASQTINVYVFTSFNCSGEATMVMNLQYDGNCHKLPNGRYYRVLSTDSFITVGAYLALLIGFLNLI